MENIFKKLRTALYIFLFLQLSLPVIAQERINQQYNRDTLLTAARNIIAEVPYCTLITLDTTGHPSARIMDPFPPEKNMDIWLGTNKYSRKVRQIKKDSRVTLFYEAPNGAGYVLIKGKAYLVDDPVKKKTYWKNEWDRFYSDQKEEFILIKVIPHRLELLDYKNGIVGNFKTWAVPYVGFTHH